MTTQNSLNAPVPLSATQGGLGVASPTAHGILIGEGSSAVTPIVLAAGQVLVGTTASDPSATTITGSAGVTVTSTSGSIAIAGSGTGLVWTDVSGTSATLAVNNAYIADNASLVTFTLPASSAVGSVFGIVGKGAGGWAIAQTSGQSIHFGNITTTSGAGGSLASTNANDCIWFVTTTANTTFTIYGSVGNITYV